VQHRVAFYPCCASDIVEPLSILKQYADEICFCDIRPLPRRVIAEHRVSPPTARFIQGDAREVITHIGRIDVLFYRRDSNGEGGSGLFVLGDTFFPRILEVFNPQGGLIITDGSNSRGGLFKKMKSTRGLTKYGWHIHKTEEQPFEKAHGLLIFSVLPS